MERVVRCQNKELVGSKESGGRLVETLQFCLPQISAGNRADLRIWTNGQRLRGAERLLYQRANPNPNQRVCAVLVILLSFAVTLAMREMHTNKMLRSMGRFRDETLHLLADIVKAVVEVPRC